MSESIVYVACTKINQILVDFESEPDQGCPPESVPSSSSSRGEDDATDSLMSGYTPFNEN